MVILLYTHWNPHYWEESKEAPYTKRSYKQLNNWVNLVNSLPLPGIGIYSKGKVRGKPVDYQKRPIVYLQIKGMRYDSRGAPYFDFKPIRTGKVESKYFLEKVKHHKLFEARSFDEVHNLLCDIGEDPPAEWMELAKEVGKEDWHDWIGKHFLRIETDISNNEFEDVAADIF